MVYKNTRYFEEIGAEEKRRKDEEQRGSYEGGSLDIVLWPASNACPSLVSSFALYTPHVSSLTL